MSSWAGRGIGTIRELPRPWTEMLRRTWGSRSKVVKGKSRRTAAVEQRGKASGKRETEAERTGGLLGVGRGLGSSMKSITFSLLKHLYLPARWTSSYENGLRDNVLSVDFLRFRCGRRSSW